MRALKRVLPVGFAMGLLASLAFAIPASATTGACTINGTAGTNPPVQLTGGTGSYTFNTTVGGTTLNLNCAGNDGTVGTIQANSAGTYTNTVCGTGTADSSGNTVTASSTLNGNPATTAALVTALNDPTTQYGILFAGGQGVFTWKAGGKITGNGKADGVISITAAGDAPGACTNHFTVAGAITGTF